jgi:hypothetical protein
MALDAPALWGQQIAAAVQSLGVTGNAKITTAQLEALWALIVAVHTTQLGKSDVAPGTFANGGGPVGGVGGPVT